MSYAVRIEHRDPQMTAVVRGRTSLEDVADFIAGAFGEVLSAAAAQHLTVVGPPFGRYRVVEAGLEVEAGFPTSQPPEPMGRVVPGSLPGGDVATTMHVGSYDGVAAAYRAVEQWLGDQRRVPVGDPWESYLDGPEVAQPRTVVCFPCARPHG